MTDTLKSYELDGAPFTLTVNFPEGSPVTSLIGGTAVAFARSDPSGVVVAADSCTITTADTVAIQFGSDDLPEGVYTVQVRVTMPGLAPVTLKELALTMRRSIRPGV